MERNEELVDVSMEVSDNVVLNRRMLPVNMLSTDNLVRNAVRRYDDAPYIPDNAFVVLRCPLDGKIPGSDYFDTEAFRANHGELPDTSVSFFRIVAAGRLLSPGGPARNLGQYESAGTFAGLCRIPRHAGGQTLAVPRETVVRTPL